MTGPGLPLEPGQSATPHGETLAAIADALARLRFGQIVVTVHEGQVVQIDTTEKRRFAAQRP